MSNNLKTFAVNSNKIESICHKLEDRLRDVQLEGLLDKELQICLLIGKKYWQLGDTEKAYMFYQSALEIALSIEDAKSTTAAYDLILNLSFEHSLCQSQLVEYIDRRNLSANITIEYAYYILIAILFSEDSSSLLLYEALNPVKGYVQSFKDGKCMWFACSILLNSILSGTISKADQDRLQSFTTRFGCTTCDLLSHVRIFHLLGDICVSQDFEKLACSFYELALSLSNSSDFTEHIYVACLLKMSKLYALEGQLELAWTTLYVAKDLISKSQSILALSVKTLSKDLESLSTCVNSTNALLSMGAIKRALDRLRSGDTAYDRHVALCRNHPRIDEILEYYKTKTAENIYPIAKFLWLCSLGGTLQCSSELISAMQNGPSKTAKSLFALGLRSLILGQTIEYGNICNDLRSLVKAKCISSNHDHGFSYFLSRGASKSLLKLVDGYKMDTKAQKKSHGLVMESYSKKRADENVTNGRPSKKPHRAMLKVHVLHREFEFSLYSDSMEVSTIGWLKSQIARDILENDFVGGDLGDFVDEGQRAYRNQDMLIKVCKNNANQAIIYLKTSFFPSVIDVDKLGTKIQLSAIEKDWLRHCFSFTDKELAISFCDEELSMKLIPEVQKILRWLPKDTHLEIRSFSPSQTMKCDGFQSCCLQGNLLDVDTINSFSSLNISNCSHQIEALDVLSSKLCPSIKRLEVADCGLVMDVVSIDFSHLEYLDLSYSRIPDVIKLFKSIAENCPNIESLILDGMECELSGMNLKPPSYPLQQLIHISMGFSANGLFPCVVLEVFTAPQFKGTIDIRHSDIVGYEDRMTKALLNTAFSKLDLSDVVCEKDIVVKSSFM